MYEASGVMRGHEGGDEPSYRRWRWIVMVVIKGGMVVVVVVITVGRRGEGRVRGGSGKGAVNRSK